MNGLARKTVTVLATVTLALASLAADASAQTRDQIGAAGAIVLGERMGVPERVMRTFNHDALTVEGSWSNGTVRYSSGGVYECRFAAAMVLATAASRTTDVNAEVWCPSYRVEVTLDVGYGGNVNDLRVVQYRRSDGEVVYRETG